MTRSTDITSFTELRQHLRDHFRRIRETGRPLYITTNGETDAVMLSPEAYDTLAERAERADTLRAVERGLEDVRAGRVTDARQAMRELADELDIKLDR